MSYAGRVSDIPAASWVYDEGSTVTVLFDLETTGLNTKEDRIVQIAAQSWEEPEKKFNIFINPEKQIHPEASKVNGFKLNHEKKLTQHGQLINTVPAKEALQKFIKFLNDFQPVLLVGHNAINFDINILVSELQRYNLYDEFKGIVWGTADTFELFKLEMKAQKNNSTCKLENLGREFLGIDGGYHDARNDVKVVHKLLKKFEMDDSDILMYCKALEAPGGYNHFLWTEEVTKYR